MTLHRRARAILLVGIFSSFAHAQEPKEDLSNWPVSPFWAPRQSIALEKLKEQAVLEPLAIEAVPTPPLPLIGINPCRIVDTRGNGFTGAYGPPALTQGSPRNFTLTGQCGISGAAQAVSLNITVTNTQGPGFILIYPQGGAQPNVSTLNYVAGQTIANAAVVPLGTAGGITVIAGVSGTDLIIDTNGYYAPQTIVNTVNGLSGTVTLAAGSNISITPSGQTLTVANTAPAAWRLTGNAGTTPGTNFVGTTDNQALELKVNSARAFRLEPTSGAPNVIGGFSANSVTSGVVGATIAGGGLTSGFGNVVTDDYGTISGGAGNRAGDSDGTTSDKESATIGGGVSNIASGTSTFIGGGQGNTASASYSTVGGGVFNVASGFAATVPGGYLNTALGDYSFAAGTRATANHQGAFVWGDNSSLFTVGSTATNQFIVRAAGGIWLGTTSSPSLTIASDFLNTSTGAHLTIGGIWTNNSDRAAKENFHEIDKREILSRLVEMPISSWNYRAEGCDVEHLGPTAQDFSAAFGLGGDDRSITTLDADGVALAAIQALYEIVREKDSEIHELRVRLSRIESVLPK